MPEQKKMKDSVKWSLYTGIFFAYNLCGYFLGGIFIPGNAARGTHGGILTGHDALQWTVESALLFMASPLLFLNEKHPESRWVKYIFVTIIVGDVAYFLYGLFQKSRLYGLVP